MRFRFACVREGLANRIVDLDVSDRIRSRRPPDRRLIDENHFIDLLRSFDLLKRTDVSLPIAGFFFQPGIDAIVNQRGLAGAAHAGHAHQHVQRNINVDRFEIVFAGAAYL